MKKHRWSFLVSLLSVVMLISPGISGGASAQSQPDMTLKPEQGKQTTPDKPAEPTLLKTQKDRVNYAIGVHLIGNIKKQGVDIDLDLVIKGMRDAFSGKKLLMSDAEVRKAFVVYLGEARRERTRIRTSSLERNKKEGEAFLAENAKKPGVIALASGLQYRIINSGGPLIHKDALRKPTDKNTVVCRYRGTLINGKEFDSSQTRGRPATFKVENAISGWREALKLMPVGAKWQLFVPPSLNEGTGKIGGFSGEPGAVLIYDLELLGIMDGMGTK